MANLEETITRVADFIKRYKCIKSIKIRFTLGKYTDEFGFEKHIFHEENYDKILTLLNNCSTWESLEQEKYEKIKNEPEKIIDSVIITCKNGPYDILITAETKKQVDIYISEDFSQEIKTYKRKNHCFNISKETSELDKTFFRASIFAYIPEKYTDTYIAHSSLLKVQDLIRACDESQNEFIFTILQKNN